MANKRSQLYWRERELEHIKQQKELDKKLAARLQRKYIEAQEEITKEINAFYGRYASKEGITPADARKRVAQIDIDNYKRKAKKYVKERNFSDRANEEMRLYNVTMRINRLEMLKRNVELELYGLFSDEERFLYKELTKQAYDEYKRLSAILGETVHHNEKMIRSIVNSSFLNATWNDLIWTKQQALRNELDTLLSRAIIQGKHPRELARDVKKRFDVSAYEAERIMRTESGRLYTQIHEDSFKKAGVKQYEVIVEPDGCDLCKKFDGKVFNVKDMEISVNAPIFHPNCRCSTGAYMSREEWDERLKERGL